MGAAIRVVVTASALAVACGGTHERAPDAGADASASADGATRGDMAVPDAGPPGVDEFLARARAARCRETVRCETRYRGSPLFIQTSYCHPHADDRSRRLLRNAVEAGRITFDPDQAQRCLETIEPDDWCEELRAPSPGDPCGLVFVGVVPEGGACTHDSYPGWDLECVEGTVCITDATCPGTCVGIAAEGEPCVHGGQCEAGTSCRDGTCQAWWSPEGASCVDHSHCESFLCSDGVCAAVPAEGEPCDPDPRAARCAAGTACIADSDGAFTCTVPPDVGEGGWCSAFWMDSCPDHLVCDVEAGMEGTCQLGAAIGADCTATPCAMGGRCVDGRCVLIAYPDAPCGHESPYEVVCPLTHHCADGRCQPLPVAGEPCAADGRCARGRCLDGVCTLLADDQPCDGTARVPLGECRGWCSNRDIGFCRPKAPMGGACSSLDACADGLVCDWLDTDTCLPDCTLP